MTLLLAFCVSAALAASAEAEDWDLSGRVGIEMDGLGEDFGTGSLFDSRIAPAGTPFGPGPLEQQATALRFQDRSTLTSGLVDLGLARPGARWVRGRAVVRTARSRTRGEVSAAGGTPVLRGAVSLSDRLLFQGGPEGFGGGVDNVLNVDWTRRLPHRFSLKLSGMGERSWSSDRSLAGVFDYTLFRPSCELRRGFGTQGDLSMRGGWGRKWTPSSALGAYRERWGEAEWMDSPGLRRSWILNGRIESRDYLRVDSLVPSYREGSLDGQVRTSLPLRLSARLEPRVRAVRYQTESDIFRNHWEADLSGRVEISGRSLLGRPGDSASVDTLGLPGDLDFGTDWLLGVGGRLGLLRRTSGPEGDYHTASAILSVSRQGSERFWFDLSGEFGRRAYRGASPSQGLVFEGLNISLSGTDYAFLSTSFLGEYVIAGRTHLELFAMYDRERHASRSDDFSLWSFTTSLTRSF